MLKIVVDRDLCEANGVCERVAPALFRVDEHDQLHVLAETVEPAQRELLERAMRGCPKRALTVTDK